MLEFWNHPDNSIWRQDPEDFSKFSRKAGCNEIGFYHYALSHPKAPSDTFCRALVTSETHAQIPHSLLVHAWAILLAKHPLLDCQFIHKEGLLYLEYHCSGNLERAAKTLEYSELSADWEDRRNDVTNCARIIDDHRLSAVRVSHLPNTREYEIVLICSHAITDGISLTICMNDFLNILGSKTSLSAHEPSIDAVISRLPIAMEAQMPHFRRTPRQLWQAAISYVLYDIRENRKSSAPPVATFRTFSRALETRQKVYEFSETTTSQLVRTCRRNGCTVGHLIYAASTAAFAEIVKPDPGTWTSIGTPVSARRLFRRPHSDKADEVVIAIAFIDLSLPCVYIEGTSSRDIDRLWTFARLAKQKVHGVLAGPLYSYQSYITQERRTEKYRTAPSPSIPTSGPAMRSLSFGSSAIGPLDRYLKMSPDSHLQIKDVSIGMRARAGESLMHSYSFKGRLRLSLVYDNAIGTDIMQNWLDRTGALMQIVLQDFDHKL